MFKIVLVSSILFCNSLWATTPSSPSIQYVGAISIEPSQDAKNLADWYQKFGVALQSAGGMYWGSFETLSGPFAFAIHPKKNGAPKKSSGSVSVVFRVNVYNDYLLMLEKRGLKPESVESDSSGHFAHYRDPDGNEMTIWGD